MKYSFQEKNPHSFVDEQQMTSELMRNKELNTSNEHFQANELNPFEEIEELGGKNFANGRSSKKPNNLGAKELTKYLSTVAVLFATTAGVVIPVSSYIQGLPQVEVVSESVGCLSYSCILTLEGEEVELEAILQTPEGETVDNFALDGQIEAQASFVDLQPETEYELTVIDGDGKERLSHEFETEPFVLIEESAVNRFKLVLHEETSGFAEVNLRLFSTDGRDFSGNVFYDESGEIFIYNDGLYKDEYQIRAMCFFRETDGYIEYNKNISLGYLNNLEYLAEFKQSDAQLTDQIAQITLAYQSGDLSPYNINLIEIYNNDYNYRFEQESFYIENNDIIVPIYENIENGEYQICIWGNFLSQDVEYYNQIWLDKININFTLTN